MLGSRRVRSIVVALGLVVAASFAVELDLPASDGCCAAGARTIEASSLDASDGLTSADAASPGDECPPGCDDGCARCARPPALPVFVCAVRPLLVVGTIAYAGDAQLAPPSPDPRDHDRVPRHATLVV